MTVLIPLSMSSGFWFVFGPLIIFSLGFTAGAWWKSTRP